MPREITEEFLDRLYPCHMAHTNRLRADVRQVNISMGSEKPEPKLQMLTRDELAQLLRNPVDAEGEETRTKWLRRMTRGHEDRFPEIWEEEEKRQEA